jgi:hypothetical protein
LALCHTIRSTPVELIGETLKKIESLLWKGETAVAARGRIIRAAPRRQRLLLSAFRMYDTVHHLEMPEVIIN